MQNTFLNRAIHGDCIDLMKTMPSHSVDLVLTDPPYVANYVSRDQRSIANDDHDGWIEPAFTEIYRLLKPDRFCLSFYGWPQADRFLWRWKKIGFRPVSHFAFIKDYSSKAGFTQGHHEVAYLLAKGQPEPPPEPIRDVLHWDYTGNPLHPNQKPLSIILSLITAFSRPGDIVLDPFAGSGTTAVAALERGRQFILMEKVARYWQAANDRIERRKL